MNPHLQQLQAYPFERLRALLDGVKPPELRAIPMSIGEPRHEPPAFVLQALTDSLHTVGNYPATLGLPEFRSAVARWLTQRFKLAADALDPNSMVLPVNGTREALFSIVQAIVDKSRGTPTILVPNPLYLIYEGAALLAGAEPIYMNADASNGFLPDLEAIPAATWERCQLLFLCSPGNPTGAVASLDYLKRALELADRYDFVVASDECYSEIYLDEAAPPPGLLQAAANRKDFSRCIVFHSLSKRSSVPGLRSGFVAGDPQLIKPYLLYRTYHGCAMPTHTQLASIPAWNDEAHVRENRRLYQEKFRAVLPILQPVMDVSAPDAGFYLWPHVGDDERFTRELFAQQHVTVVPGRYFARDTAAGNPGQGRVRLSLVPNVAECIAAAERIRAYAEQR
ncbi:MAG TPA: succinyldiaminopimelate transaminase, partial [Steroidobacteraceae bacterium]|nr:succinyldiaminopimelate transaminase [Steroidobacteraceae bacterium]